MKPSIQTLKELKNSGYKSQSIKEELRENLIVKLNRKEKIYDGIWGFDDTVIPDMERAILSQHNILLLGLRGQAKTRIARLSTHLLHEYIPYIEGSEINDDPLNPISKYGIDLIAKMGDKTPIAWLHRDERYIEKLATPDVSIADLVGDVDPIKAATLKLPYSDERVIHFGLIPRSHRSIFVINELPDLQARIQVALFNMLQEGDLQIRGFKLRMPLDICFIFTANPEDYTQRGSIITPLKDRIESQILTHYPLDISTSKKITSQEARVLSGQENISVPETMKDLIEKIVITARNSEYVDEKSGVSARVSISAYENLISSAERRAIINSEKSATIRLTDLWGIIPAMTGKMELVYEGEQEGAHEVALDIINAAVKGIFLDTFVDPDGGGSRDPYGAIKLWFADGNAVSLPHDLSQKDYNLTLSTVPGLEKLTSRFKDDKLFYMELILHGLASCQTISKQMLNNEIKFGDDIADLMRGLEN